MNTEATEDEWDARKGNKLKTNIKAEAEEVDNDWQCYQL